MLVAAIPSFSGGCCICFYGRRAALRRTSYTSNTQETTAQQFLRKHAEAIVSIDRDRAAILSERKRGMDALKLVIAMYAEAIERIDCGQAAILAAFVRGTAALQLGTEKQAEAQEFVYNALAAILPALERGMADLQQLKEMYDEEGEHLPDLQLERMATQEPVLPGLQLLTEKHAGVGKGLGLSPIRPTSRRRRKRRWECLAP